MSDKTIKELNKFLTGIHMGGATFKDYLDKAQNLEFKSTLKKIIESFKINVSMCFVGVIMGELLVSKEGIGYLIMYGSQVFNMNYVIMGVVLLVILTVMLYCIISYIEKISKK